MGLFSETLTEASSCQFTISSKLLARTKLSYARPLWDHVISSKRAYISTQRIRIFQSNIRKRLILLSSSGLTMNCSGARMN